MSAVSTSHRRGGCLRLVCCFAVQESQSYPLLVFCERKKKHGNVWLNRSHKYENSSRKRNNFTSKYGTWN